MCVPLPCTTWLGQSPSGWRCCILHLAEHIQHIRGVTNPFLAARTFQRVSVPVNNTSSGFHTSEQMCVWHTEARVCVRVSERRCYRQISGVYVCLQVSVWSTRASMASLEWLIRGEVEESVRLAPVKGPRALSLSVLTPLNLSLSSLTLTHSTSIDASYPAALQRPEENPLQWLSIRGEPWSLQRRKDYIMRWHTEQDVSGFSGCLVSFADIYGWTEGQRKKKKTTEFDRSTHLTNLSAIDRKCWIRTCINFQINLHLCLLTPGSEQDLCPPLSLADVSGVRSLRSTKKRSEVMDRWVLLKYILASFRDIM